MNPFKMKGNLCHQTGEGKIIWFASWIICLYFSVYSSFQISFRLCVSSTNRAALKFSNLSGNGFINNSKFNMILCCLLLLNANSNSVFPTQRFIFPGQYALAVRKIPTKIRINSTSIVIGSFLKLALYNSGKYIRVKPRNKAPHPVSVISTDQFNNQMLCIRIIVKPAIKSKTPET